MAFRRNFIFRLTAELLSKGLAMGVTVALARGLGPEAWGGMQWALAGTGLFGVLADFGLGSLATRELALAPEKERRAWLLATWQVKGALWAFALLLFAGIQVLSGGAKADLLLPAAVLTVALSLGEFSSSLYSGFERLDLDFQWGLFSKLAQAAAALGVLAMGGDVRTVLLSMAAAAWAGWALSLVRLWPLSPPVERPKVGPKVAVLWKGLWPFGLVSVLTLIYVKADNLLLERLVGLPAVGIYQSAYKWFEALAFIPAAFIAAGFPGLARAEHEAGGEAKRMKAFRAMLALGATAAVFLFAWAPVLPRLLGPAYQDAPPLLRALATACLVWFPNFVLVNLLIASRRQGRVLVGAALAVAFNLAGNLWFMPRYGALGAAWMTAGTEAVIFLAAAFSLHDHLTWAHAGLDWMKALLASVVGCLLSLSLGHGTVFVLDALAVVLGPLLTLVLVSWWGLMPLHDMQSLFERALRKRTG